MATNIKFSIIHYSGTFKKCGIIFTFRLSFFLNIILLFFFPKNSFNRFEGCNFKEKTREAACSNLEMKPFAVLDGLIKMRPSN